MPRFIYFDAAATLIRPNPSVGQNYADLARDYGIEANGASLEAAFRSVWKEILARGTDDGNPRYGTTRREALEFWTPMVREVFSRAGYPLPPDAYFTHVYDYFTEPRCWALYPDVEPAFQLLERGGVPFGVLSNFDERLPRILNALGVLHRFSAIVHSGGYGVEKPHIRIFRLAEELAKTTECALIGDSIDADGEGARRAGWNQCLILREGPGTDIGGLKWRADLREAVRVSLS